MNNRVTNESMRHYVEDHPKEVRAKTFEDEPGLVHISYKRHTFYRGLWNDHTRQCRGTVVREGDFQPVLIPFPKIFDYGTPESHIGRDAMVSATRKVNGFMIGVAQHPFRKDQLLLSTTGSLSSPFVSLASSWIEPHKDKILEEARKPALNTDAGFTFIFEVVDQLLDPHIVKEESGLYLIGRRTNIWGSMFNAHPIVLDMIADRMGVMRPESHTCMRQDDVHEMNRTTKSEGFIVEFPGVAYKLKSPYYRAIRLLGRMSDKNLDMLINNKNGFIEFSRRFISGNTPEFNRLLNYAIDQLSGDMLEKFVQCDNIGRIALVRDILDQRG